jgi:hypothetical protein
MDAFSGILAFAAYLVQCVSSVEAGGEVDCLLLGGGYLFAGIRKASEGIIKVWNMATAASHLLTGHKVWEGLRQIQLQLSQDDCPVDIGYSGCWQDGQGHVDL